jgi:hypothetical protein
MFAADGQRGYKVKYDGGSLADTEVGSGLKLVINSSTVTFLKDKAETVTIPTSALPKSAMGKTYIGEWNGGCRGRVHTWGRSISCPEQIQETFCRVNMGRRRQKGWIGNSV